MGTRGPVLVDFTQPDPPRFQPVDDRVMGGRSMSRLRQVPGQGAVFEGIVSRRRSGSFASVRAGIERTDLAGCTGVRLRVRGDGRRYRLTLRNDRRLSGVNHQAEFDPPAGEWVEIVLPFEGFDARRRGARADHAEPLDPSRIRQVGLMIADGEPGPFRLAIEWIRGDGD